MVRASWRVSSTLPAGGSEESETAWHMFEYIGMTCHENVTFVYWAANKIRSWMGDDQGLVYIHTYDPSLGHDRLWGICRAVL